MTLTAEEEQEFRDMRDGWAQVQAALKMGTSLKSSYDGHLHREIVIQEHGDGTPTFAAKQRTLYVDDANKKVFFNDGGSTSWTLIGGGTAAGEHTLDSGTHVDVANMTEAAGDLLIGTGGAIEKWANLPKGTTTQYFQQGIAIPVWRDFGTDVRAAVKYEIYLSFGSERETIVA